MFSIICYVIAAVCFVLDLLGKTIIDGQSMAMVVLGLLFIAVGLALSAASVHPRYVNRQR